MVPWPRRPRRAGHLAERDVRERAPDRGRGTPPTGPSDLLELAHLVEQAAAARLDPDRVRALPKQQHHQPEMLNAESDEYHQLIERYFSVFQIGNHALTNPVGYADNKYIIILCGGKAVNQTVYHLVIRLLSPGMPKTGLRS